MNYCKIYADLIAKRKLSIPSGYVEKHHIIPRCLGGSDEPDNLVKLTAREHFIAHLLLTKCYEEGTNEYHKMVHAFFMMASVRSSNQQRFITSHKYERLKHIYSDLMSSNQSGCRNSQYDTVWVHDLTTNLSKKMPRSIAPPSGYVYGRSVNNTLKTCKECGVKLLFKAKSKYCGEDCSSKARVARLLSSSKESEFHRLYSEYIENGYRSVRQFAKTTDYSHVTITRHWKKLCLPY